MAKQQAGGEKGLPDRDRFQPLTRSTNGFGNVSHNTPWTNITVTFPALD